MADEEEFIVALDMELRDQFLAEAEAANRPASELLRELIQEFVVQRRESRDHEVWLRGEIERGVRDADDPAVSRIAHEKVALEWQQQRAALVLRAGERGV